MTKLVFPSSHSPAFVTDDADVNITAHRLLWGKYFNNGQVSLIFARSKF